MAQQFLALRANPISGGRGTLRHERLTWWFESHPSPLGRAYDARLEYRQGRPPRVFIEQPDLVALADGRDLPHVYSQLPPQLCLYLPGAFELGRHHRLDLTIVPWTALWLFYFEEWLWSDEWKGGGVHPGDPAVGSIPREERN